ncbi:hypothetical protein Bbelb_228650 [Branchiostoma belcheri]|nr:hypothetical protein Bbelb_228650 [Branchiostoma belcheri]
MRTKPAQRGGDTKHTRRDQRQKSAISSARHAFICNAAFRASCDYSNTTRVRPAASSGDFRLPQPQRRAYNSPITLSAPWVPGSVLWITTMDYPGLEPGLGGPGHKYFSKFAQGTRNMLAHGAARSEIIMPENQPVATPACSLIAFT